MNPTSAILFLSNSPGELSYWVQPIARHLKVHSPDRIRILYLLPCQYASGKEADIAKKWGVFDHICTPKETLKKLLSPTQYAPKGIILFLGGDPLYGRLFSIRLKWPVIAYTNSKKTWGWPYKHTFQRQRDGDLMACSATIPKKTPKIKTIGFLPGSRPQHYEAFWQILTQSIRLLNQHHPEYKVRINISPFITPPNDTNIPSQVTIEQTNTSSFLNQIDFLVALPGSNNAEAMYTQCPMLIVVPLNRPDLILFDGLLGLLGELPLIGTPIKKAIISIMKKQKNVYSLPNKILPQPVVTEYIEVITPPNLVNLIIKTITNTPHIMAQYQAFKTYNTSRPKQVLKKIEQRCNELLQY